MARIYRTDDPPDDDVWEEDYCKRCGGMLMVLDGEIAPIAGAYCGSSCAEAEAADEAVRVEAEYQDWLRVQALPQPNEEEG